MQQKKRRWIKFIGMGIMVVCAVIVWYVLSQGKITISPLIERQQMMRLEQTKEQTIRTPFVTDGCSGNVSKAWSEVVGQLSSIFSDIDERYFNAQNIPFEYACEAHDKLYHEGTGGYVGRLQADNTLRREILEYAITHTDDIKRRTRLKTDESAIFLYETIADIIYRGVRLGGAPCSGESYAWGYGYGGGTCEEL